MNWKAHAQGMLAGLIIFMFAYLLAHAGPDERAAEGRETFEIACWSLEAAIEFAAAIDYNRCFAFAERFGFEPWGFLTEVHSFDTGFTIYTVDWGNGAPGVYAVK